MGGAGVGTGSGAGAGAVRLVARTRPLDPDDPATAAWLAAADHVRFEHHGDLLVGGIGPDPVALRIALPRDDPAAAAAAVTEALTSIEVDDTVGLPGCGPVAFGALPFTPSATASMVVPNMVIGRTAGGACWRTTVAPEALLGEAAHASGLVTKADNAAMKRHLAARHEHAAAPDVPAELTIHPVRPPDEWCDAVAAARDQLRAGWARKVVLARELAVGCSVPIDVDDVLAKLRSSYAGCFVYSMPLVGGARLVGASPELLVARAGEVVRSHPMAGTAPRSGDPAVDLSLAAELLASLKDQVEHRITIDMVHDTLLPWCSYLDEEAEPSIVAVANVQHLATMVEGRLSHPPASVIELVTALHPTPAVCGDPRDEALALIRAHEGFDRGSYAGPVGWVDHRGNGEWAVGIRCAEIAPSGRTARLFAGVGVVPDSDPAAELAETDAKFRAMLTALGA